MARASERRTEPGSPSNRGSFVKLLNGLAVESEIKTFALDVLTHAQADNHVDDFKDDQGHDHVIDEHGADADELGDDLAGIAFEQAGSAAIRRHREHAGEDGTGRAADRMDAERVERIVIAEEVLEPGELDVINNESTR